MSNIDIRPIQTIEHYRAIEQLQKAIWGLEDIRVTPDNILITAHKNGGMVLGAFDTTPDAAHPSTGQPPLIGFVFGFVGLTTQGSLKYCSHQLGILPAYQNRGIGHQLKLAQRNYALERLIDHITWTFDPLESRNAYLNIHKLGVTCNTYLPNVYGMMRDAINVGLPSDRFQVDWWLTSTRVTSLLVQTSAHERPTGTTLEQLRNDGVTEINPLIPGDLPRPPLTCRPLYEKRVLVHIPADFQAVKTTDNELARVWRQHIRDIFEEAFAMGYTVIDVLRGDQTYCYLLEQA
ncbi:MAG: hypothetical protein HC837_12415 [Chloroflexaceae bacterium]|nr:hypothetical protein [Chloroflexaceae bacterium]